jgi:microcystin-dependent protein
MAMNDPAIQRRHFLSRLIGAMAGGSWLGRASQAEAAPTGVEGIPFVGEIRMFAGDFEPYGWRFCDGRLLLIAEYETLFQLIGTTYGGDGQETFGLPDLRGRIPFHPASTLQLGEPRGQESVTLLSPHVPAHTHDVQGNSGLGVSNDPSGAVLAKNALGAPHYSLGGDTFLAAGALTLAGNFQPHDNVMPSLCVHFIICLDGVWPSPS